MNGEVETIAATIMVVAALIFIYKLAKLFDK